MKQKKCWIYVLSVVVTGMLFSILIYNKMLVRIPCSDVLNRKYDKAREVFFSYGIKDISCNALYDLTGENEEDCFRIAQIKIGNKIYHYPEDRNLVISGFLGKSTHVEFLLHAKKITLCIEEGCSKKRWKDHSYCLNHLNISNAIFY